MAKNKTSILKKIGILLYILLPGLIIFREYISLQKLFLFVDIASDSLNIYYPRFVMLANAVWEEGFSTWSFQEGVGQTILPLYTGPFNWIYILAGKEQIPYLLFFVEYFKLGLSGVLFYNYLRIVHQSQAFSAVGAILYAYCASIMVNVAWLGPSHMAFSLALGLLIVELLFQKGKWALLPLFGFLIGSPVMFVQIGMVLLVYAFLRFKWMGNWSVGAFFKRAIQGLGFLFLGIGMKLFIYFSKVNNILNSPRGSGEYAYKNTLLDKGVFGLEGIDYYWTIVYRFFSNDLIGNGVNFAGWENYFEAPSIFAGLLPLLLLPQLVIIQNKRVKWAFAAILSVITFTLIFPFFRYAFWLFAGNYFRFFGHVILVNVLLMGLYVLKEIIEHKKINLIGLGLTLLAYIGILFVPNPYADSVNTTLRMVIIAFFLAYALLLILYTKLPKKINLLWTLLILIPIEIVVLGHFTYHNRLSISVADWEAKKGYNDYTVDAVKLIKENDKSFHRIEKDYFSGPAKHRSLNEAKIQGYFDSSNYSSFNHIWYVRFLAEMGLIEKGKERKTRWIDGVSSRLLLCFFTNTKYKLIKNTPAFAGPGYKRIGNAKDIEVYQNQLFLPFGNTYDKFIKYEDFKQLKNTQKDVALLKGLVIHEDPNNWGNLSQLDMNQIVDIDQYSIEILQRDIVARSESQLQIYDFKEDEIKGKIEVNKDKALFFTIPYDNNWKAYVNGKETPLQRSNIGFMALPLQAGKYEIHLKYEPFMLRIGLGISFVFLLITIGFFTFFKKELK